ncbi:MAG: 30S ribosomal protein S6 [Desulfomicrobium escambiense]|nr:30S ribosomal protein S6 [Desulfomicrobium escambiense]
MPLYPSPGRTDRKSIGRNYAILRTRLDLSHGRRSSSGRGKESVAAELVKQGAQNVKEEDMGDRPLAYPIRKKAEGHYILFAMNFDRRERRCHGKGLQAQPEHPQVPLRPGRRLAGGRAVKHGQTSALSYWSEA